MADDSDLEKTEAPTGHRQSKAREEGQIPRSREMTSVLMLSCGLAVLWFGGESMAYHLKMMMTEGFSFDRGLINDEKRALLLAGDLLEQGLFALLPMLFGSFLIAAAAPMFLGGIVFSTKALEFDLSKLDPISGIKRIFSVQVLAELFKGIIKAVVVGCVVGWYVWHHRNEILHLISEAPINAMGDALGLVAWCALLVLLGLIPMVGFDIFWQIYSHMKKLRMTKQEIKDEHKEQEGNPQIKAKIRRQQLALSRRRMMADVPKASVVVTNPTHFAVALQYDEKKMSAPKLLAKGTGEIALRIRELAKEHRIPILEAPPLARALYRHTDIGQNIPTELYAAVAEVLAWVYQLKRWRREGGVGPKKPKKISVPAELDYPREKITDG